MQPYVYKITNKITNEFYIGKMSCGKIIGKNYFSASFYVKEQIERFGLENFLFEILEIFDTKQEASEAEFILIDKHWNDPLILNKAKNCRGIVDWDDPISRSRCIESRFKFLNSEAGEEYKRNISAKAISRWRDKEIRERMLAKRRETYSKPEIKKMLSERTKSVWRSGAFNNRDFKGENNPMFGKEHSDDAKLKMRDKKLGKLTVYDKLLKKCSQISTDEYHSNKDRYLRPRSKEYQKLKADGFI